MTTSQFRRAVQALRNEYFEYRNHVGQGFALQHVVRFKLAQLDALAKTAGRTWRL